MEAEDTGVPESVFRRVGLATRLPVMMIQLMFIVICDVGSSVLVLTGRRRFGWARLLLPLILSRNPSIPELERKIGVHCNFSFQTGNGSSPVDMAQRDSRARAARCSPRRVEDLIGGDPSGVCRTGRRPLKPQTVLLRWRRAVGLRRTAAASRAERKRASKSRVLIRVQKRASPRVWSAAYRRMLPGDQEWRLA